jgi:alpha-tubulin suppressor-like RCC1 family protein
VSTSGEVGDGSAINRTSPVQVGMDTDWGVVTTGVHHTCAIKTGGTLWCWGYNRYGEVGNGNFGNQLTPLQVGTDANWSSVSAGQNFTCATKTDGTVWCWGENNYQQLGVAAHMVPTEVPIPVP